MYSGWKAGKVLREMQTRLASSEAGRERGMAEGVQAEDAGFHRRLECLEASRAPRSHLCDSRDRPATAPLSSVLSPHLCMPKNHDHYCFLEMGKLREVRCCPRATARGWQLWAWNPRWLRLGHPPAPQAVLHGLLVP